MVLESFVGDKTAGVKAQVDPAADTETALLTWTVPFDVTIKEIVVGYANVVDAKAMTGYMELKSSLNRGPFRFPIGFGTGGAATLEQKKPYILDVNIPVTKAEELTLYVTMCEASVGMFGQLSFIRGKSGPTTYGECNTAEDAALSADTLENGCGTLKIPATLGGVVKKILVSYANVVNAKSAAGYMEIRGDNIKGELHEFVLGGGSGGATNAGGSCSPQMIETDFNVVGSEQLYPYIYLAEAAVDGHVGVLWVA